MTQETLYSEDAELAVVGALLGNNTLIEQLPFLKDEYFHIPVVRKIFNTCKTMISEGFLANPITLRDRFKSDEDLQAVGGVNYLIRMAAIGAPDPVGLAKFIRELAKKRYLLDACEETKKSILSGSSDLVSDSYRLSDICEKIASGERQWETRDGVEVTQSIIDGLKSTARPFSSGLKLLDEAMGGGIYPGKLYAFSGKKKHGKTIMGGSLSCNLAQNGVKHLFICGEMSPEEVHQRNLARMGEFYPSAFRDGYSHSKDFNAKLSKAMDWQQHNILYHNAPGITFERLRHIVRRAITYHQIKGYILDYWQLVGGKPNGKSTSEHLDEVAQWLADTCRKHGVFGIAMAQINQEGNTRSGEGLRLSCDQMYQIHRPDIAAPGMWLEMMDSRYTRWMNIGDENICKMQLNEKGPYFEQI